MFVELNLRMLDKPPDAREVSAKNAYACSRALGGLHRTQLANLPAIQPPPAGCP